MTSRRDRECENLIRGTAISNQCSDLYSLRFIHSIVSWYTGDINYFQGLVKSQKITPHSRTSYSIASFLILPVAGRLQNKTMGPNLFFKWNIFLLYIPEIAILYYISKPRIAKQADEGSKWGWLAKTRYNCRCKHVCQESRMPATFTINLQYARHPYGYSK